MHTNLSLNGTMVKYVMILKYLIDASDFIMSAKFPHMRFRACPLLSNLLAEILHMNN